MSMLSKEDLEAARDLRKPHEVVRRLAEEVSTCTTFSAATILGSSRAAAHCRAREIVVHAAYRHGLSLGEIGEALGRDHASILNALRNEQVRRGEKDENGNPYTVMRASRK